MVVGLPVNTVPPAITGSATVGGTLTSNTGTWSNNPPSNSPTSYSYQWQRCYTGGSCNNVLGRTTSTYSVGLADVNAKVQVVVTATNAAGSVPATSAATALVPAIPGSPTASYKTSNLTPVPATGSPMTFTSTSTPANGQSITSLAWDFGDGVTTTVGPTVTVVSHSYASPGAYTVTLTVTQTGGLTAVYSTSLTVDNPPISGFAWSPSNPSVGTGLTFVNTASAGTGPGLTGYSWSFGDGATSSSPNPTHTYTAPGTYTVTLTVTQFDQLTATSTQSITVAQAAGSNGSKGSTGSGSGSGGVSRTVIRTWLVHALTAGSATKIGRLLKKKGVSTVLKASRASGHLTIAWYATVRHHRLVVARGAATLRRGSRARLAIKLTAAGHALLARSKTVKITISASFHSGATSVTAARKLTLRR